MPEYSPANDAIVREPEAAARRRYDVIVVGGGIYGAMATLESALRGLKVLLVEKADFGAATSYNSLRTIHGGLRYLQTLDLKRHRELVLERRWFLRTFPHLVRPLPILMPLYNRGIRRVPVLRVALGLDRFLSGHRNDGLPDSQTLPGGRIVTTAEVRDNFSIVETAGLRGGALWYDAQVPTSQRLVVDVLRAACGRGASALNYVRADELMVEDRHVRGVTAYDVESGRALEFQGDAVINAGGPWTARLARSFDIDFNHDAHRSVAWNVLFDRTAPSDCALAVSDDRLSGQIYFLHPWNGRLLAGTGHAPRSGTNEKAQISVSELQQFIQQLNSAVPALGLRSDEIVRVFAGYLPVTKPGGTDLLRRDHLIDHATHGGPRGLVSITGTKLTSARLATERAVRVIAPDATRRPLATPLSRIGTISNLEAFDWMPSDGDGAWIDEAGRIAQSESVVHLDDLIFRRTEIGDNPIRARALAPRLCRLFDWDAERCRLELERIEAELGSHFEPTPNPTGA